MPLARVSCLLSSTSGRHNFVNVHLKTSPCLLINGLLINVKTVKFYHSL